MKHFNLIKFLVPALLALFSFQSAWGLGGGTYVVGVAGPGTYATLADAMADANLGITGAVTFSILPGTYTGTDWQPLIGNVPGTSSTNTLTIQSLNGPGTVTINQVGVSGTNYVIGFNAAKYIKLRNLTLVNTSTTQGTVLRFLGACDNNTVEGCKLVSQPTTNTATTGEMAVVTAGVSGVVSNGSNFTFTNDTFQNGSISYLTWGTSSTTVTRGHYITNCVMTGAYWSGIYSYYGSDVNIIGNRITLSGAGTTNGIYSYYNAYGTTIKNNIITMASTGSTNMYGIYLYYNNYIAASQFSTSEVSDNKITISNTSTATINTLGYGYSYGLTSRRNKVSVSTTSTPTIYLPYYALIGCFNSVMNKDTFSAALTTGASVYMPYYLCYAGTNNDVSECYFNVSGTTGTVYPPYYCLYSSPTTSRVHDNTFNVNLTSGTISNQYSCWTSGNTYDNNLHNYTTTTGTIYVYNNGLAGLVKKNLYNLNSTTGAIYFETASPASGTFTENTVKMNTTTGTIYSLYNGGGKATVTNNIFDARSSAGGIIYGYFQYSNATGYLLQNNIFTTNTTGPSYLFNTGTYNTSAPFAVYNNTFHSNSTGYPNQLLFTGNGSTSNPTGVYDIKNNIFSRTASFGFNDTAVYSGDTAFSKRDHNLYWGGGSTMTFRTANPATVSTVLNTYRAGTGIDMNSLIYNPGYIDAANNNLRPDPANPNSWSVNGRGLHLAGDTVDFTNTARPKTRQLGVCDLGAYEFTPSSIPPAAVATPAAPAANTPQAFTFGQDTVCVINWGTTVPASATVRQYTGTKASGPSLTAGVERMFFYVDVATPAVTDNAYKPQIYFKRSWLGNISTAENARLAKSSNGAGWKGYNYTNGVTNLVRHTLGAANAQIVDSMPSQFTGVENGRIGVRCMVPPVGLKATNITAFSATEIWEGVYAPFGYQYYYSLTPGIPANGNPGIALTGSNSAPLTGLMEDTLYYVYVRTICSAGDTSAWSADSFRTILSCHPPELKLNWLDDRRAILYWNAVRTAVGYEFAMETSPTPPANGVPVPDTYKQFSSLADGTMYYIFVRSVCSTMYNKSEWAMTSFTTWPAGVNRVTGSNVGLMVYPNPAHEQVTVDVAGSISGKATISILDVTGKLLRTEAMTGAKAQINLNGLASGVYMLRYTDEANSQTIKITKE